MCFRENPGLWFRGQGWGVLEVCLGTAKTCQDLLPLTTLLLLVSAALVCRYGGGRADLSDTMAGTLWVADALFTFAANGARAFHLHWGHGGLPYEGGSPNVGVQTNFDYNVSLPIL